MSALAVRIGSSHLDSDNVPGISTMPACCQGLVTIEKGTSTVKLIHYTLQECIRTLPNLFDKAHSTMAETCLTYLNLHHVKDLSAGRPLTLEACHSFNIVLYIGEATCERSSRIQQKHWRSGSSINSVVT